MMEDWSNVPQFGEQPHDATCIVRLNVYGLIEDEGGRLAIVRTPQGVILPGGGIEPGETPERALEREVLEECGHVVTGVGPCIFRAVQFVFAEREGTWFEKRCMFFGAGMETVPAFEPEQDHELLWEDSVLALDTLTHESQRRAVEVWEQQKGG